MITSPDAMSDVAKAIQLALVPVFLLTGISSILGVMMGRLSRIVDRGRVITEDGNTDSVINETKAIEELRSLERRRHLTSVAITSCTVAALLVCTVIVALFGEVMLNVPLDWLIGSLFTAATLALVFGLASFLREVNLATRTVRIHEE